VFHSKLFIVMNRDGEKFLFILSANCGFSCTRKRTMLRKISYHAGKENFVNSKRIARHLSLDVVKCVGLSVEQNVTVQEILMFGKKWKFAGNVKYLKSY